MQQPIRIHSFVVHDYALLNLATKEEILDKMSILYEQVKKVNGELNVVFSNELLGRTNKLDWKKLYETILTNYNV